MNVTSTEAAALAEKEDEEESLSDPRDVGASLPEEVVLLKVVGTKKRDKKELR